MKKDLQAQKAATKTPATHAKVRETYQKSTYPIRLHRLSTKDTSHLFMYGSSMSV